MNINYEELTDRLELSCIRAHAELVRKYHLTVEEFKEEVKRSLQRISDFFIKRHHLEKDEKARKAVQLLIDMYKRKCIEDFIKKSKK